jgi:ADP-ribosylglycohydrolase
MSGGALDRAYGALLGLAIGDALGMPTQLLSYGEVAERYGVVDRFHPGPADHPIAAGLPAGRVTDDTDQALIIGRLLVARGGHVAPYELVAEFQAWEQHMIATGSADLLGPSTKRALERIAAGEDVAIAGRGATTNGAAMRIAPVGIAIATEPLDHLVDVVVEVSRPTHGSGVALAGAAAVAAVVSAGVEGQPFAGALELALRAATLAAEGDEGGSKITGLIRRAVDLIADVDDPTDALSMIDTQIGTSLATDESVPAAFAIAAMFPTSPWDAARYAATVGGDSDTIAAMAGAMVGAHCGTSGFPADAVAMLEEVNPDLGLRELATALLALRSRPGDAART